MQSKTRARSLGIAILAILLGFLLVGAALGQDPIEPEEVAVDPEPEASAESAAGASSTPSVEQSGAVLDYEPTESISEDLSVAFPVDI